VPETYSFRAYALGEAGPVKVNDWEVLKMKIRSPLPRTKNMMVSGRVTAHFSKNARSGAPPSSYDSALKNERRYNRDAGEGGHPPKRRKIFLYSNPLARKAKEWGGLICAGTKGGPSPCRSADP
jgi:hypothetical protein